MRAGRRKPALIDMKTAILLLALAGLLFAGTASATAIDQPSSDGQDIRCAPLTQPVCYAYYYYCNNYLGGFCPLD